MSLLSSTKFISCLLSALGSTEFIVFQNFFASFLSFRLFKIKSLFALFNVFLTKFCLYYNHPIKTHRRCYLALFDSPYPLRFHKTLVLILQEVDIKYL